MSSYADLAFFRPDLELEIVIGIGIQAGCEATAADSRFLPSFSSPGSEDANCIRPSTDMVSDLRPQQKTGVSECRAADRRSACFLRVTTGL